MIEILTDDLIKLDSGKVFSGIQKKEWSVAIDNVISQLEGHAVLLSHTGDREDKRGDSYLPPGKSSDTALNKVFSTGSLSPQ